MLSLISLSHSSMSVHNSQVRDCILKEITEHPECKYNEDLVKSKYTAESYIDLGG